MLNLSGIHAGINPIDVVNVGEGDGIHCLIIKECHRGLLGLGSYRVAKAVPPQGGLSDVSKLEVY